MTATEHTGDAPDPLLRAHRPDAGPCRWRLRPSRCLWTAGLTCASPLCAHDPQRLLMVSTATPCGHVRDVGGCGCSLRSLSADTPRPPPRSVPDAPRPSLSRSVPPRLERDRSGPPAV